MNIFAEFTVMKLSSLHQAFLGFNAGSVENTLTDQSHWHKEGRGNGMSEQKVLEAIKKLHSPQVLYSLEHDRDLSYESEEDASYWKEWEDEAIITFMICTHCGSIETSDDGEKPFRDSLWPCYTAQIWLEVN